MPPDWKPLARTAVDDLFKEYVKTQFLAAIQSRQPNPAGTFLTSVKFAVGVRDAAYTAIDTA